MEAEVIIQAIGTLGFPIVACAGLFWMVNTTVKQLTDAIQNLEVAIVKLTLKEDEK